MVWFVFGCCQLKSRTNSSSHRFVCGLKFVLSFILFVNCRFYCLLSINLALYVYKEYMNTQSSWKICSTKAICERNRAPSTINCINVSPVVFFCRSLSSSSHFIVLENGKKAHEIANVVVRCVLLLYMYYGRRDQIYCHEGIWLNTSHQCVCEGERKCWRN